MSVRACDFFYLFYFPCVCLRLISRGPCCVSSLQQQSGQLIWSSTSPHAGHLLTAGASRLLSESYACRPEGWHFWSPPPCTPVITYPYPASHCGALGDTRSAHEPNMKAKQTEEEHQTGTRAAPMKRSCCRKHKQPLNYFVCAGLYSHAQACRSMWSSTHSPKGISLPALPVYGVCAAFQRTHRKVIPWPEGDTPWAFHFPLFPSRLPLPGCLFLVLLLQTQSASYFQPIPSIWHHGASLLPVGMPNVEILNIFFSLVCLFFYFLLLPPQSCGCSARTLFTFPILWYFPIYFDARVRTCLVETNLKSLVSCN